MFSNEEIPQSWFTGPLTPQNRRKILSLDSLGGGRFSVFAKIEIGRFNIYLFFILPDEPYLFRELTNSMELEIQRTIFLH